jgi:phospholipid/cholesterol/gamma-HCH transport system permease protein
VNIYDLGLIYEIDYTPDGVARATTLTVVISSLLVLWLDFIMTAWMFTTV